MIILFFLLVLAFSTSQAQDWAPVRGGEVYHYVTSNPNNPSASIATSFWGLPNSGIINSQNQVSCNSGCTIGGKDAITIQLDTFTDSIGNIWYTPKPLIKACDTCSQDLARIEAADMFPTIADLTGGGYRILYDGYTFDIPEHPVQTSLNDPTQQITGGAWWYVSDQWSYHPSVVDSFVYVDVIINANPMYYYEFVFSKTHGLYKIGGPNGSIRMYGKEGPNPAGYQSLQFDAIFDFNVGDQFYYEDDHFSTHGVCTNFSPAIYLYNIAKYRHKILQRQDIGSDTILYMIERIDYDTRCSHSLLIDTFTQMYTSDPLERYNAREGYWSASNGCPSGGLATAKEFFFNSNLKYVGYDLGLNTFNYTLNTFIQDWQNPTHYQPYPWGSFYLYQRGLGALYAEDDCFENYSKRKLLGYIKGADTVGQTPAILITGVQDVMKQPKQLSISPNPASSTLSLSQAISGQVTFYNHLGQIVYQTVVEEVTELSVNELPVGSYWVHWQNETATLRQKVLIIR